MIKIVTKAITTAETFNLRQKILRPNQPRSSCVFPGDELDSTLHGGAFLNDQLLGIASLYQRAKEGRLAEQHWQLRGMAVDPDFQGRGIGGQLLNFCVAEAKSQGAKVIWCNARSSACKFYRNHGFLENGSEFDIPGIGPHFIMTISI